MRYVLIITFVLGYFCSTAQNVYTKEDSIRGSVNSERIWWDLKHYSLSLKLDIAQKAINGSNKISYKVLESKQMMQIDLQPPLKILKVIQDGKELEVIPKGINAYTIVLQKKQVIDQIEMLEVFYEGVPKVAIRAPWDGGFSWSKDEKGNPFVATSCQGLGASVWWPCKDHMYDEPDSMKITVTVPDKLWNVSNGRLTNMILDDNGNRTTEWTVRNPINNYGVNLNVANYVHFTDIFNGQKGDLSLDYYVLPDDLEKAKKQFKDVNRMLTAFEYWFGPYPFYEDGYKLVQVPYLGMEHQSSVTYGNNFKNGYLGRDLSGTGWGTKWDFIIVHESGHEWFANNITYKDVADMWIHESFTNYSETLFTEYHYGKAAGEDYVIGTRKSIRNDVPIIADYGVNKSGSGDMYYKGGNMIHTIRQVINDDNKFRQILIGLNKDFYHQTVTTKQIEDYISKAAGVNFSSVFDLYLRGTKIPKLVLKKKGKGFQYCWENVDPKFYLPIRVKVDGQLKTITPSSAWKNLYGKEVTLDRNYYISSDLKTF